MIRYSKGQIIQGRRHIGALMTSLQDSWEIENQCWFRTNSQSMPQRAMKPSISFFFVTFVSWERVDHLLVQKYFFFFCKTFFMEGFTTTHSASGKVRWWREHIIIFISGRHLRHTLAWAHYCFSHWNTIKPIVTLLNWWPHWHQISLNCGGL